MSALEELLNAASEKFVRDRLSNYVKSEILNSEKMTPKFLKIAEKSVEISLAIIKDEDGSNDVVLKSTTLGDGLWAVVVTLYLAT